MKNLYLIFVCFAISIIAPSCLSDFDKKHSENQKPMIPFDFNWNLTQDVALTVGAPIVEGVTPDFAQINVYSSATLDEKHLLAQGKTDAAFPLFRAVFTLPVDVENIYVQTIIPDGSRAAKMVPVTSAVLNIPGMRIEPAQSDASRALFAKAIVAAELTATSITIPVVETIPSVFDVVISKNPANKLYIGGDGQKTSYYIPAGVTIDKNINMSGWVTNLPTLYVAGRLELTNTISVEKTRLVILKGGEVNFENGLIINNSFNDKASVYLFDGGELSVKSLTFSHGQNGLMVSRGRLFVTDGRVTMSGGRLYTTTGINPGMNTEIDLMASDAQIHNDGAWIVDKMTINAGSVFTNYENGMVKADDVNMDKSILNQKNVFKAKKMTFSSRVTVNNYCLMTVDDFEMQAQSVINLASGALLRITGEAVLHSSTVNFGAMSMLNIEQLSKQSYVSDFNGPDASTTRDGAQAVMKIKKSEYKDQWNPMRAMSMIEIVTPDDQGICCSNGATIVSKQTVNIPTSKCNEGAGNITPAPIEPIEMFDVKGATYTYSFEDGWPWCGDYDMNDMVVVSSVDRRMKNGKVETIRINWEARASGAGNTLAFAVCLDKIPTTGIASVVSSHQLGRGAFITENGLEVDNENAVIPLFNRVSQVFGLDNAYVNTEIGMPKTPIQKHTTTVTFTDPVAQEAVVESALNFFLVVSRPNAAEPERWREIHLPLYQPTKHAVISGLNTVNEKMPYKYYAQGGDLSNNGLMWGLRIPGEFQYPSELNDIRVVYTDFLPWAKSGGMTHKTWYQGGVVEDKIYK